MQGRDRAAGGDEEMQEQERLMKELEQSFVDPLLRLDYDSDEEDLIPSIEDVLGHAVPEQGVEATSMVSPAGLPMGTQQMTAQGTVPSKARWLASIDRSRLPASYRSNSKKEELCLQYADDFYRQFVELFPDRRPLLLALENEAGVPKLICTTLRPTIVPVRDLYDLDQIATFVARHCTYEPLANPVEPPDYLPAPTSVLERRCGDAFDLSVLTTSLLLGSGYDAYCVFGTAPQWVALADTSLAPSPFKAPELPGHTTGFARVPEEAMYGRDRRPPTPPPAKYDPPTKPELSSKYEKELDRRRAEEAARRAEEANYESDEDISREHRWLAGDDHIGTSGVAADLPDPDGAADGGDEAGASADPLQGMRAHAWVLVRAGRRDVPCHLFVEPSTGYVWRVDSSPYVSVESVWNPENIWVNMQGSDALPEPESGDGASHDGAADASSFAGADSAPAVPLDPADAADPARMQRAEGESEEEWAVRRRRAVAAALAQAPSKVKAMLALEEVKSDAERAAAGKSIVEGTVDDVGEGTRSAAAAAMAASSEDAGGKGGAEGAHGGNAASGAGDDGEGAGEEGADSESKSSEYDGPWPFGSHPCREVILGPAAGLRFDLTDPDDWEIVFIPAPVGAPGRGGGHGAGAGDSVIGGEVGLGEGSSSSSGAAHGGSAGKGKGNGSELQGGPGGATESKAEEEALLDLDDYERDGEHVLDVPRSWCRPLRVDRASVRRAHGLGDDGALVRLFYRARLEEFAEFAQPDGLVCRSTDFADDARLVVEKVVELFANRNDKLIRRVRLPRQGTNEEWFGPGRERDGVRMIRDVQGDRREVEFYRSGRQDGLLRRIEHLGSKIVEHYDPNMTKTRVCYRSITFGGESAGGSDGGGAGAQQATGVRGGPGGGTVGVVQASIKNEFQMGDRKKFEVRKMAERYARNPEAEAHDDIERIQYLVEDEEILVTYHRAAGRITRAQRQYLTTVEDGGMQLVSKDPFAPLPTKHEAIQAFRRAVVLQKACYDGLRERQRRCGERLAVDRDSEESNVRLERDAFEVAAQRVRDGVALQAEEEADEEEEDEEVDFLAPFLIGVDDPYSLTYDEAKAIMARSYKALYQRYLERINVIQRRLEGEEEDLQARQSKFARSHGEGAEATEEFERLCAENMYRIRILQERRKRQDLQFRQKMEENRRKCASDERLAIMYRKAGGMA